MVRKRSPVQIRLAAPQRNGLIAVPFLCAATDSPASSFATPNPCNNKPPDTAAFLYANDDLQRQLKQCMREYTLPCALSAGNRPTYTWLLFLTTMCNKCLTNLQKLKAAGIKIQALNITLWLIEEVKKGKKVANLSLSC